MPLGDPAAVLMIHSFSAADPANPNTIAGRWLANGAFAYFGSMNEPFLEAFRPPALTAELIAAGLPLASAARIGPGEFDRVAAPWRLLFLGDPLYRLDPNLAKKPRAASWDALKWPSLELTKIPGAEATEDQRLEWTRDAAYLASTAATEIKIKLPGAILSILRERLNADRKPIHDALLVDLLFRANRLNDAVDRLGAIPETERTPDVERWRATLACAQFERALEGKKANEAAEAWGRLMLMRVPIEVQLRATRRLGATAASKAELRAWLKRLQGQSSNAKVDEALRVELAREARLVAEKLDAPRAKGR